MMKLSFCFLAVFSIALSLPLAAQDSDKKKEEEPVDPNLLFKTDFNEEEAGDIPDLWMALDGAWKIEEVDGSNVLALHANPLVAASIQLGKSAKGEGAIAIARIKADRKRRSAPRFGIGLHGGNGFQLRINGATKKLELRKGDEQNLPVQSVAFDWRAGEWHFMEITAKPAGNEGAWTVSGKVWAESDEKPEQSQIEYIATDVTLTGKASLLGTPYAGMPIYFDDFEARKIGEE